MPRDEGGVPPIPVGLPKGKVWETVSANEGFLSAVCGESTASNTPAVLGINDNGGTAIYGQGGDNGEGVHGEGKDGVHGKSTSPSDSGVWGENTGSGAGVKATSSGVGVWASGKPAGHFDGDVQVTGHIIGPGGDLEQRISALEQQVATLFSPGLAFEGPISQIPHLIETAGDWTIKLFQPLRPGPSPPMPPVTGPPEKRDKTSMG